MWKTSVSTPQVEILVLRAGIPWGEAVAKAHGFWWGPSQTSSDICLCVLSYLCALIVLPPVLPAA